MSTLNLGFQSGVQFLIAKRIAVDFYFMGFEAGFLSGNVTSTSPTQTEAATVKTKIVDAIAKLPSFLGDKLVVTQPTNTEVNVKASSIPYPWLRGGISIGIAF